MSIPFKKQFLSIVNGMVQIVPFILIFEWLDIKIPIIKIAFLLIFSVLYFLINWGSKNPTISLIFGLISDLRMNFVRKVNQINEPS